jgi:hypothetical protein
MLSPNHTDYEITSQTCILQVWGESKYGAGDAFECGRQSTVECASDDCSCCPCARHVQRCPTCFQPFCASSDSALWTCFHEHFRAGQCPTDILRIPLDRLADELESGRHPALAEFVCHNSDGLGNPLPQEVCDSLGLAVACANGVLPEYNADVLTDRKQASREHRSARQKLRRAAKRLGMSPPILPLGAIRAAPHRNSTIHLATGAVVTRYWTGRWHYREQNDILRIMGRSQSVSFIQDRVDYLRSHNATVFGLIESRAAALEQAKRTRVKLENSRFLSLDLSL